jgi:hypothetical protein
MSQSPSLTPAPPASDALVYRPLSALALASVLVSALYALLVLVIAVVAVIQAGPMFLPTWTLLAPAVGVVLALAGQWRIRRAEGTLAGMPLTRWGLWLGLLGGLGYGTYYFFTGLAIQQQANDFLMKEGEDSGFFPRLLKAGKTGDPGELNRAFLLTKPYGARLGSNPDDLLKMELAFNQPQGKLGRGELDVFRDRELIEIMLEAGREGQTVEPLGVRDWAYENGKYHVSRAYRLTTREMQVDVVVPVSAEVDKVASSRKWYVNGGKVEMAAPPQLTPLGQAMQGLRQSAGMAAKKWAEDDKRDPAHLTVDKTAWKEPKGLLVVPDETHSEETIREQAQADLETVLRGKAMKYFAPSLTKQIQCPWQQQDGHLLMRMTFTMPIHLPGSSAPGFTGEGTLYVQSRDRLDPLQVTRDPQWDVIAIRLERIHPLSAATRQMMGKQLQQMRGPGG